MLIFVVINTPLRRAKNVRREHICKVSLAHVLMMVWWVLIHKIIRQVVCSFLPIDDEVSLSDVVARPVNFHVGVLGEMFHVIAGDFSGTLVFRLHD